MDNHQPGRLRGPSLIQLDQSFDSLAKRSRLVGWEIQWQRQPALARGWPEWSLAVNRRLREEDRLCFGKIYVLNDHSLNSAYLYGPSKEKAQIKHLDGLNRSAMGGQIDTEI